MKTLLEDNFPSIAGSKTAKNHADSNAVEQHITVTHPKLN